jgi:hypothetical protein
MTAAMGVHTGPYVRIKKDGACELLPVTKVSINELNMWVIYGAPVLIPFHTARTGPRSPRFHLFKRIVLMLKNTL